ncbi:hypothetical protein [Clostridium baratii]
MFAVLFLYFIFYILKKNRKGFK